MLIEISIATGVAAAAIGAVAIGTHNRLARLAQRCDHAFADIDVQLRYRSDLIPMFVETVQGYIAYEKEMIARLLAARNEALAAATQDMRIKAENNVSLNLTQLLAEVGKNPQMNGAPHFVELRRELGETEHKLAATRRYFNLAVSEYNATLTQFPGNLVGSRAGMRVRDFFDLGVERVFKQDAPLFKLA